MKKTVFILMVTFVAGCTVKLLNPSQSDVDKVQTKFPNYTLAELNQGKALYEQHCGNCHRLKKPTSHSEEQWKEIVPEMANKVNKKSVVLNAKAQEDILKYVITMSGASK
jgi:nitrate/TMAO reductase-like tetraheme cytochrome c subunit